MSSEPKQSQDGSLQLNGTSLHRSRGRVDNSDSNLVELAENSDQLCARQSASANTVNLRDSLGKAGEGNSASSASACHMGRDDAQGVNNEALVSFVRAVHVKYQENNDHSREMDNIVIMHTSGNIKTTESGTIKLPKHVSMSGQEISVAGDQTSIQKMCARVTELDLMENNISSWEEVFTIIECIPHLTFLNLTNNRLTSDLPPLTSLRSRPLPSLTHLVLNSTGVSWSVLAQLLMLFPRLLELHLSLNKYDHFELSTCYSLLLSSQQSCVLTTAPPLTTQSDGELCEPPQQTVACDGRADTDNIIPNCAATNVVLTDPAVINTAASGLSNERTEGNDTQRSDVSQVDNNILLPSQNKTTSESCCVVSTLGENNPEQKTKSDLENNSEQKTKSDLENNSEQKTDKLDKSVEEGDTSKQPNNPSACSSSALPLSMTIIDKTENIVKGTELENTDSNQDPLETTAKIYKTKNTVTDTKLENTDSKPETLTETSDRTKNTITSTGLENTDSNQEDLQTAASTTAKNTSTPVATSSSSSSPPATNYPTLKRLFFTANAITDWAEMNKLGKFFPSLEYFLLSETAIEGFGDAEAIPLSFPHLKSLGLGKSNLSSWEEVEKLRRFPCLNDVRLSGVPFLENLPEAFRFMHTVALLPNITTLNGSRVGLVEREDAERAFLRTYMDVEVKPERYFELERQYGKLDPLAQIELKPRPTVRLKVRVEDMDERVIKQEEMDIEVDQTVRSLRKLLSNVAERPAAKIVMFYLDNQLVTGLDRLIYLDRKLFSYNMTDGDEIIVSFKD